MKKIISVILILTMLLSLFSVVPAHAANSSHREWKQSSGYWKSYKLGGSSKTMKSIGCTTTALAIAAVELECESINDFDPGVFVTRMNNIGGYNKKGAIYWDKINKVIPNMSMVGSEIKFSTESNSTRIAKISENLNKGYAVLITILRYTDTDGYKHWHYVLADSVNNGVLNILDPGGANGNITKKYGSAEIMIRSIRVFKNNGKTKHETEVVIPPQTHTCSYSVSTETTHPHNKYNVCSCGKKVYLEKNTVSSCSSCYPVGNVRLTREYEKTKGTATFYRNNVSNATKYTLKVYRNDDLYDTYTMNSDEYYVSGLPSGEYYAVLYAKNTATGEERSDSCPGFKISDSYTVSYNANGGSNAPSSQIKIEDTNLTLTSSVPTKPHYVFKGWARSKNATVAEYQPGDTYNRNAKATLYAVWEPETYTIKFDANGGKGELLDTTITYGDAIRIPNNVICDYSYLKGWSTSKTATTATYKIGMDYKFDANATLYAVWGTSTWSGGASASLSGSGTEVDPYLIQSESDLGYLANKVNSQTTAPKYEYYKLINNINLAYNEWVPIGLCGNEHQYFYGSFDGNGFTISDLYITKENEKNIGLFGYVKDSEIKDLTVTGAIESVTSSNTLNIGTIVGCAENTTLKELRTKYFNIGSIATGSTDYSSVGSVVGKTNSGIIDNCESYNSNINLKSGKFYTGMIVGCSNSYITNCKVESTQGGLFSTSAIISHLYMGGLCGLLYNSVDKSSVKAPYLSNNLKTSHSTNIGGLVGHLRGSVKICSVQFNDSNENSITSTGSAPIRIGGFVGFASSDAKITDCKFDGKTISGTTTTGPAYVGGLVGDMESKTNAANYEEYSAINHAFVNVDGDISAVANETVYAGSIIGRGSASADSSSLNKNIVGIVDNIYSTTTGSGYIAYSGNVIGYNEKNKFNFKNTYYNTEMNLTSSTNTFDVTSGIARSSKTMSVAFYTDLLGLVPYFSLSNLEKDENAVWILKNGQLPELYYNCLNDITISDDIENGTVTIDKTQAVDGEVVTVTATANDGYVLNKVYVDGIEQDGTTFVVDGNDEVYVTFAKEIPTFDVSVTADENASASLVNRDEQNATPMSISTYMGDYDSEFTAKDGEEIQVNTSANTDYSVDAIYVNGEEIAGNSFILTEDSVVTMDVTSISTDVIATTNDAEDVGSYFAVVSGSVSSEDENAVKYIRYWSADDTETVYTTEVETGTGDYSVELIDLEPETTYYYQMTEFGKIKWFTTEEEIVPFLNEDEIEEGIIHITSTTYEKSNSIYNFSIQPTVEMKGKIVFIAGYTNENDMISINEVNTNTEAPYNSTLPVDSRISYVKVFVLESKGTLKPLEKPEIVNITE